ncbi:hypothetical protein ACF1DY_25955 [Streptomyces albus]
MTGQLQFDVVAPGTVNSAAGERAKTAGMASAAQATAPTWADACDAAIRLMARRGIPFQAADLIAEGLVDEPDHPSQWGPRFAANARRGVIRLHSYGPSKRTTVHKSICKTWIGTA